MSSKNYTPTEGEIREARAFPNGWIYRIDGQFVAENTVPPEAIIGAWEVNSCGEIIEDFKENPKYSYEFCCLNKPKKS